MSGLEKWFAIIPGFVGGVFVMQSAGSLKRAIDAISVEEVKSIVELERKNGKTIKLRGNVTSDNVKPFFTAIIPAGFEDDSNAEQFLRKETKRWLGDRAATFETMKLLGHNTWSVRIPPTLENVLPAQVASAFFSIQAWIPAWKASDLSIEFGDNNQTSKIDLKHTQGWMSPSSLFMYYMGDLPVASPLGFFENFSAKQLLGSTPLVLIDKQALTVVGKVEKLDKNRFSIGDRDSNLFGTTIYRQTDGKFAFFKTVDSLFQGAIGAFSLTVAYFLWSK